MHIITGKSRGFVLSNLPATASRLISIAGHVLTTRRFHGFYTYHSSSLLDPVFFFLYPQILYLYFQRLPIQSKIWILLFQL